MRSDSSNKTVWTRVREGKGRCLEGAVLFEVVLALVLFVAAATIVSGGLSASMNALDRLRFQAHAADLAVSVLSELQLGVRPMESAGPEPFEKPFEAWTWELVVTVVEVSSDTTSPPPLRQVEIVVRHQDLEVAHRLQALLPARPAVAESPTGSTRAAPGDQKTDTNGLE